MLFNKINKNAHSLGAQISYSIGMGDIKDEKGLHSRLKETIKRSDMDEFKLGRRQYKELGGTNYGKYLKDGANNPFSKLESNEFRKYNLKMASNLNKTIMSQNPFKVKSLGNFSLPNLGGVTAQYFEGGVNMQGDYFLMLVQLMKMEKLQGLLESIVEELKQMFMIFFGLEVTKQNTNFIR